MSIGKPSHCSCRIAQTHAARPCERRWPHRSQLWIHRYRIFSGICTGPPRGRGLYRRVGAKIGYAVAVAVWTRGGELVSAAACQSGNLSVNTDGARLYVDIVREVQREATARMA